MAFEDISNHICLSLSGQLPLTLKSYVSEHMAVSLAFLFVFALRICIWHNGGLGYEIRNYNNSYTPKRDTSISAPQVVKSADMSCGFAVEDVKRC